MYFKNLCNLETDSEALSCLDAVQICSVDGLRQLAALC